MGFQLFPSKAQESPSRGNNSVSGALPLSGGVMSGPIDMDNIGRISNVPLPVEDGDLTNKYYVDSLATLGVSLKKFCRAASIGSNVTLSGLQTLDGVSLVAGDRVLIKDQTLSQQNGIYTVAVGAWARSSDADSSSEILRMFAFVAEGTVNKGDGYALLTSGTIVLDTTPLQYTQIQETGQFVQGNGITIVGDVISVDPAYVGQTSISELGTVTIGTWQGTTITVAKGGTGATTATQARINLNVAVKGANNDITSLSALTTPLSLSQGGTDATDDAGARVNLNAAKSDDNSDITSLSGLTTPLSIDQGGTGATTDSGARSAIGAAVSGNNSDITSITGLTTPLAINQGGTGLDTVGSTGNILISNGTGLVSQSPSNLNFSHFISSGSTPSIAKGPGAGTSGVASITGTDVAGTITIDTNALDTPSANATIATVTFASAFAAAPRVLLMPANDAAYGLSFGTVRLNQNGVSSTQFVLTCGAVPFPALTGATYKYNYFVVK